MADPATYRPAPGSIPVEPGVYRFSDQHGRVIYVGKAKSLRGRLNSYFADIAGLHPRTRQMVTTAAKVEWTVVNTEVEALQLEYNWIKEFDPRFNVRYRDDKSYPVLAVTLNEEYPRLMVYRGPRRKGVRYFGPYSHAWAIRETLDLLTRVFPARTCSAGVFKRHNQIDRPCLLGYIDKCSAPCVGRVSAEQHRQIVMDFCDFLSGKTDKFARGLEQQMHTAAAGPGFRTRRASARRSGRAQAGAGEAGRRARRRHRRRRRRVRRRRPRSRRPGVPRPRRARSRAARLDRRKAGRPGDSGEAQLVEQFLTQFYGDQAELDGAADESANPVPREVLVPCLPPNAEELATWLTGLRGSRVALRVPRRGDKRALAETVQRNAKEALQQHKLKRAGDFTARSAALQNIQEALGLADAPLRIECVDISHVQGTDVVGSLVVFEDGLPRKSDYRHFGIREAAGGGRSDDVASIAEVTRRRFIRHIQDQEDTKVLSPEGKSRRFAYPPNLYVVDGGAPQVNAASAVLEELGVTDVAVIGLAKRLEEVWVPSEPDPIILPRNSEGLYLLQRVRDEAHRFAINYHRSKRSKRMTASALDSVPGLGEHRRKALVAHFGSLARLREATVDEITSVPGIGVATATAVLDALRGDQAGSDTAAQDRIAERASG